MKSKQNESNKYLEMTAEELMAMTGGDNFVSAVIGAAGASYIMLYGILPLYGIKPPIRPLYGITFKPACG